MTGLEKSLERLQVPAWWHHVRVGWRAMARDVRRLYRRYRPLVNFPLLIGVSILAAIALVAIFGPLWTVQDPYITAQATLPHFDIDLGKMIDPPFPPSWEHPMGTDALGNDLLSFVIHGARVTLILGLVITTARLVLGLLMGGVAGWLEDSLWDRAVMAVVGVLGSVPMIIAALVLILSLGVQNGAWVFVVGLAVAGWTEVAQQVRGEMLVIRRQEYIQAAKAIGLSELQLAVRHALPNLIPALVVMFFLDMGLVLILVAELGFLGVYLGGGSFFVFDPVFGAGPIHQIEIPEWGALVAQGTPHIRSNPYILLGPALTFFVAIMGFNALGEGLRKAIERRPLSTGFLLSKRGLLFCGGALLAAGLLLNLTGPNRSYVQVSKAMRADRAAVTVSQLTALEAGANEPAGEIRPATEFIRDAYRSLEIGRGVRLSINSRYVHHVALPLGSGEPGLTVQVPMVAGYWAGYDLDLADELIIVLAKYDGLEGGLASAAGREAAPPAGVGLMLEMAQSWKQEQMDPRRSIMFLAWGGGNLGYAGLESFLTESGNFTRHPIPSREVVAPSLVIQLEGAANGGSEGMTYRTNDERLRALLRGAAAETDLALREDSQEFGDGPFAGLPVLQLQFDESVCSRGVISAAECDTSYLERVGRTISLVGIKLARQATY